MTAPEAYIRFTADDFGDDGTITNSRTEEFLRDFMAEFREHVQRVLTVLPRQDQNAG
jgi:chromate reductase